MPNRVGKSEVNFVFTSCLNLIENITIGSYRNRPLIDPHVASSSPVDFFSEGSRHLLSDPESITEVTSAVS